VDLTNDDVADILALLDSLPYDALDLRTDRFHLRLRRAPDGGWTEESELLTQPTYVTPEANGTTAAGGPGRIGRSGGADEMDGEGSAGRTGGADGAAADADGLVAVVAPLPGTFYRAPRPGAPPFVEVGDTVGADTVIAIIETMKLMNSVPAGTPGRVARILVENGAFAPLATALMLLEPDPGAPGDPDFRTPGEPDS
jgi:acetyl-CoA carboxylase biotin carboxyl carrier protein